MYEWFFWFGACAMRTCSRFFWARFAGWMLAWGWGASVLGQHAHLNAGAMGSVAGNALYFANGFNFVTNSGYFLPLKAETNGPYAGHHQAPLTLTALPATGDNGGPAFGHAAPGTRIEVEVVTVTGPAGGQFGFWDSNGEEDATELTFTVPVGEKDGRQRFRLSENQGEPGADPYGHIHGRRFSATVPGLYVIGFRLVDTGGNGAGGGPLHPASEIFPVYMQAGLTVAGIELDGDGIAVSFAAEKGRTYRLERTLDLPVSGGAGWTVVAGPFVGGGAILRVGGLPMEREVAWYRLTVE